MPTGPFLCAAHMVRGATAQAADNGVASCIFTPKGLHPKAQGGTLGAPDPAHRVPRRGSIKARTHAPITRPNLPAHRLLHEGPPRLPTKPHRARRSSQIPR